MIKNQYKVKSITIRTNNGPEFLLPTLYNPKGICHKRSCVETPQ